MAYIPTIVVDDDNPTILKLFRLKAAANGVKVVDLSSWDKTKEYLESGKEVDAVVLDARGQMTADSTPGDEHLLESLTWVKAAKIPYAIYTAYTAELPMLKQQLAENRVFSKGKHKEEDVFEFLKQEIAKSPKAKYPEPFACFGGNYLDVKYQEMLMNVVLTLQNEELTNPEAILFNPCRIILESVFQKVNEFDERVLPYALLSYDDQRVGLINCSKYLNGITVTIRTIEQGKPKYTPYSGPRIFDDYISQQVQTIIGICHPASHAIQNKYSTYTFKSVLWALFDVLIWLKNFIDERS
ncbi:hypothetical protein [Sunxiuqinia rutila]|uniref:hypothetical protein n=1 Tax=Sunxiuqinia rutila TaxID=1397841 RepID=UPI003D35D462